MSWIYILMNILVLLSALMAVIFFYKSGCCKYFGKEGIDWIPFGLILMAFAFGVEIISSECGLYFFRIKVIHNFFIFLGFISFSIGFIRFKLINK